MKKISILMATLVAVLTLGSCKQNTEPCIQKATDFKLNTPALASQYYQLTPEGTVDLDWSQPDWGFAAAASKKHSWKPTKKKALQPTITLFPRSTTLATPPYRLKK